MAQENQQNYNLDEQMAEVNNASATSRKKRLNDFLDENGAWKESTQGENTSLVNSSKGEQQGINQNQNGSIKKPRKKALLFVVVALAVAAVLVTAMVYAFRGTYFENGVLTIDINCEGTLEKEQVDTSLDRIAFKLFDFQVKLGDGVVTIGDGAFSGYENLVGVSIPNSVTAIGNFAFSYCGDIKELILPESVISIGNGAFYWCDILTGMLVPVAVTQMGFDAFYGCYQATIYCEESSQPHTWNENWNSSECSVVWGYKSKELCVEKWDISLNGDNSVIAYLSKENEEAYLLTVSGTGEMKSWKNGDAPWYSEYRTKIKTIVIENGIENIGGYAFVGCIALESIEIANSVSKIGISALETCVSLKSVELPRSLTELHTWALRSCLKLSSISIDEDNKAYKSVDGNLYTKDGKTLVQYAIGKDDVTFTVPDGVETLGAYSFYDNTTLLSVTIPQGLKNIERYAFGFCTRITSFSIPEGVKNIGKAAFSSCDGLESIIVDDNNEVYKSIDGNLYTKDGKTLIQYAIGKNDVAFEVPDGVTTVGEWAMYGAKKLVSVTIPHTVTSIEQASFFNCYALASIVIPQEVISLGEKAFDNCKSLTIYCEAQSQPSTWDENWNFFDCPVVWDYAEEAEYVEAWNISATTDDSVTAYLYNDKENEGYYTLVVCGTGMPGRTAPWTLSYSSTIKSVIIEEGVTAVSDEMFLECTEIESVTLPEGIVSIGFEAFYGCSSLKAINLPSSLEFIDSVAFAYCNGLTSIKLPSGLQEMRDFAFMSCSNLKSVFIPNSVTGMGECVFEGCSQITIYCEAQSKPEGGWSSNWNHSDFPVVWGYNESDYNESNVFLPEVKTLPADGSFGGAIIAKPL